MAVERVVIALVANDIDHEEALTVVSASSNPSKGSFDSPDWMPSDSCLRCRDATDWTTASVVWSLTVDPAEIRSMEVLGNCDFPNTITTISILNVSRSSTTGIATAFGPFNSSAGYACAAVPGLGNSQKELNCGDIANRHQPLTAAGINDD